MVDVVEATLVNHGVFTCWHAHDAEVASTQYMKVNEIPSPSSSDTNSS
jgi:hypothetical protein